MLGMPGVMLTSAHQRHSHGFLILATNWSASTTIAHLHTLHTRTILNPMFA